MGEIIKKSLAEVDLDEIWDYIAADNPESAEFLLRKLYDKMNNLADNPYLGKKRDELLPDLRSFPVGNYIIFYFPRESGIEVVRVLHGARKIEELFIEEDEALQ